MSTVTVHVEDDQLEVEVIVTHPQRDRALSGASGILSFMTRAARDADRLLFAAAQKEANRARSDR